jgi:dCMP deaminase
VRPDWDGYFLGIASAVAARADCTRRQVGAVIVKGNRIVSTGYNGAPSGLPGCLTDGRCPRGKHYMVPRYTMAPYEIAPKHYYGSVMEACACSPESSWPCPEAAVPGSSYDTGPGSCISIHAEANALLYADRDKCEGATLYCTDQPCDGCKKLLLAGGIHDVKWPHGTMGGIEGWDFTQIYQP